MHLRNGEIPSVPMGYKAAMIGMTLSMFFIMVFCLRTGMSLWAVVLFMTMYYMISLSLTYLRAQLGSPVHQMDDESDLHGCHCHTDPHYGSAEHPANEGKNQDY